MMPNADNNKPSDAGSSHLSKKKAIFLVLVGAMVLAIVVFFSTRPNKGPQEDKPAGNVATLEQDAGESDSYEDLVNLSLVYLNENQAEEAIPILKKAIAMNPKGAIAYNNLGVAYTELKQYQLAIDACKKAIELDGNFELAVNNLKWALDEQRRVLEETGRMQSVPKK